VSKHFKAKLANIKTSLLSKLLTDSNQILHNDKDHQVLLYVVQTRTSITSSRWRTATISNKIDKQLYLSNC